jgi:hypothetical protein
MMFSYFHKAIYIRDSDYTSSSLSVFLHIEAAVLKGKYRRVVFHEHRKYLLATYRVFTAATINKDVLFTAVPMKIAVY